MSSQTFKAQVALGSWTKAPFWPGLSEVTKIVEREMKADETPETQADVVEEDSEGNETDF